MDLRSVILLAFVTSVASHSELGMFETKKDHSVENSDSMLLEYYYNEEFYSNGPAILLLGGETPVAEAFVDSHQSFPVALAIKLNGIIFALAHRCYSKFQDSNEWLNRENLKYCTSEQALQDFVLFIQEKSKTLPLYTRWIVVGCSYPGRLAIELRAKYPELVFGAWVSSAPVMAQYNFPEYFSAVRTALLSNCERAVSHFVNHKYVFRKYLLGLSSKCSRLMDDTIVKNAWEAVQNGWYSNEYNNSITNFCSRHHLYNCAGSESVDSRSLDTYDEFAFWDYQTCHEFGWFLTKFEHRKCSEYSDWNPSYLQRKIEKNNNEMLSMLGSVSRVMLVYGSVDPWTEAAPIKTYPGVVKIVVPGGFHCQDWQIAQTKTEQYVLVDAQVQIIMTIREWLRQTE